LDAKHNYDRFPQVALAIWATIQSNHTSWCLQVEGFLTYQYYIATLNSHRCIKRLDWHIH